MASHAPTLNRPNLLTFSALIAIAVLAIAVIPPLPQDPVYHVFADSRPLWGIPHFWNVVTSLPFLAAGIAGLAVCLPRPAPGGLPDLQPVYLAFFSGVALVGFGSTWYHLDPSRITLVWDRLPMVVAFMAFLCLVVGERLSAAWARRLLAPLVLAGVASVLYWHMTELRGGGDLRPYLLVQYLPMLLIPAILLIHTPRLDGDVYLWLILLTYGLAKVAEFFDAELFALLGVLSGHSLKHLLASLAAVWLIVALVKRRATTTS